MLAQVYLWLGPKRVRIRPLYAWALNGWVLDGRDFELNGLFFI